MAELFTPKQAAEYTGWSLSTIRRLAKRRVLRPTSVPGRGVRPILRYRQAELDRVLSLHTKERRR